MTRQTPSTKPGACLPLFLRALRVRRSRASEYQRKAWVLEVDFGEDERARDRHCYLALALQPDRVHLCRLAGSAPPRRSTCGSRTRAGGRTSGCTRSRRYVQVGPRSWFPARPARRSLIRELYALVRRLGSMPPTPPFLVIGSIGYNEKANRIMAMMVISRLWEALAVMILGASPTRLEEGDPRASLVSPQCEEARAKSVRHVAHLLSERRGRFQRDREIRSRDHGVCTRRLGPPQIGDGQNHSAGRRPERHS